MIERMHLWTKNEVKICEKGPAKVKITVWLLKVSVVCLCQWQHWTDLLPAPTFLGNKLQTRQTPSTNSTEHIRRIRLPYFASEHTMHRWTHTYIASRRNIQQSVPTAPTVMRLLNISCSTAHCTTTSDPDYCQLNQILKTRYMDPLHNCNEQPPTTCQPWTDVTRLSEVWGTKKGKR